MRDIEGVGRDIEVVKEAGRVEVEAPSEGGIEVLLSRSSLCR
jgi:hypothetical protein